MDLDLNAAPSLNFSDHSALYSYLRDVSNDSTFATSILQVLIEERCTAHRTRWNNDRAAKYFNVGDIIKVHVQVQSNATTGTIKKAIPLSSRTFSNQRGARRELLLGTAL